MDTQRQRVLLVEDDPLTREALAYILEVEGYVVDTAEDGQQGLERLHQQPHPSIVLLDLGLPIVSGQEFLQKQKRDPNIADIPVVVITAAFEPSVPEATAVLPKPVDLPRLRHSLSEHKGPQWGH